MTRMSFSPLLVGSVVATIAFGDVWLYRVVSVPYWSGQWLQRPHSTSTRSCGRFQSPIGRVSGCNWAG